MRLRRRSLSAILPLKFNPSPLFNNFKNFTRGIAITIAIVVIRVRMWRRWMTGEDRVENLRHRREQLAVPISRAKDRPTPFLPINRTKLNVSTASEVAPIPSSLSLSLSERGIEESKNPRASNEICFRPSAKYSAILSSRYFRSSTRIFVEL